MKELLVTVGVIVVIGSLFAIVLGLGFAGDSDCQGVISMGLLGCLSLSLGLGMHHVERNFSF